jgi:hypothetical protein
MPTYVIIADVRDPISDRTNLRPLGRIEAASQDDAEVIAWFSFPLMKLQVSLAFDPRPPTIPASRGASTVQPLPPFGRSLSRRATAVAVCAGIAIHILAFALYFALW